MAGWDLNIRASGASHGKYGHVIIDRYMITGNVKKFDGDVDTDNADGTGLGMEVEDSLPGISKVNWKIDGMLSTVNERSMFELKRRQSPFFTGSFPKGFAAGALADCMPASFGKYSKGFGTKEESSIKAEVMARAAYHEGVILLSPKTLLTGTSGVGPEDDNTPHGGATTFGGALYAWLPQVNGGTTPTITFKLTHSTTLGGTYTDVVGGALPAMSIGTSDSQVKQLYIPSTSTIQAFTQIAWTATGTPTNFQPLVVSARGYDRSL